MEEKEKRPPSYAKVSRRQYREDFCNAVIDTSSCCWGTNPKRDLKLRNKQWGDYAEIVIAAMHRYTNRIRVGNATTMGRR